MAALYLDGNERNTLPEWQEEEAAKSVQLGRTGPSRRNKGDPRLQLSSCKTYYPGVQNSIQRPLERTCSSDGLMATGPTNSRLCET